MTIDEIRIALELMRWEDSPCFNREQRAILYAMLNLIEKALKEQEET